MEVIAVWLSTHIAWAAFIAYVAGSIAAGAFARYMIAVARRRAGEAAMWDFTIMFFAHVVALMLWAKTADSPWVLLGYIFGNSSGTYVATKLSKKDKDGT